MDENENKNVNQENNANADETKNEVNSTSTINQTQEPKKKSNTGLIVTIVILAIIIVVLIGAGVFFLTRNAVEDFAKNGLNDVEAIIDEGEEFVQDVEEEGFLNAIEDNYTSNGNNTLGTNTVAENTTDPSASQTNEGANNSARESSLENPLQVGELGIASKYNTETSSDQNVNVRVTNIIRGDEAKEMAKEYMSRDYSIYKYEEPEAYLEWVVIEYDVDFADTYVPGELGASPNVEADITGPDGSSLEYNGITYITSTIEIGSRDYIKAKTGSGKILTQIPIGCTDYIIQFGRYNGTTAYFQGQ